MIGSLARNPVPSGNAVAGLSLNKKIFCHEKFVGMAGGLTVILDGNA